MTSSREPDFLGWAPDEPLRWDDADAAPAAPPRTPQPAPVTTAPRPAPSAPRSRTQAPAARQAPAAPSVSAGPRPSGVPTPSGGPTPSGYPPPPYHPAGPAPRRPRSAPPFLVVLIGFVFALFFTVVVFSMQREAALPLVYGGVVATVLLARAGWAMLRR